MPGIRSCAMNDQDHQTAPLRYSFAECGGHSGIAITEKFVVGIEHGVIVLGLIEHRIFAAGRDYDIFDAVAIQIAEDGCHLGEHGELVAKLFLHELVVDFSGEWWVASE